MGGRERERGREGDAVERANQLHSSRRESDSQSEKKIENRESQTVRSSVSRRERMVRVIREAGGWEKGGPRCGALGRE